MKKGNSIPLALHTLFWVAVLWIFAHYSYLRPIDPQHVQYEYISAVFLMAAVYIGWFVLIPKLFEMQGSCCFGLLRQPWWRHPHCWKYA